MSAIEENYETKNDEVTRDCRQVFLRFTLKPGIEKCGISISRGSANCAEKSTVMLSFLFGYLKLV